MAWLLERAIRNVHRRHILSLGRFRPSREWPVASCPSPPPERLVAFMERIGATDADVFQHRVVEAQQGAALAIDLVPLAQPDQHGAEAGANVRLLVGGEFQA